MSSSNRTPLAVLCLMIGHFAEGAWSVDNGAHRILYGTTSGECIGYCTKELEIAGRHVTFIATGLKAGRSIPPVRQSLDLTTDELRALERLKKNSSIASLPERVGCPDCNDGGAEWIELPLGARQVKRVTFEKGNPPSELRDLSLWLGKLQEGFVVPATAR